MRICSAMLLALAAVGVARSNAQAQTPVPGRYVLDVVRRDSAGKSRVIDRLLMVMTDGPMPLTVARTIRGPDLQVVRAAPRRGVCWRSVDEYSKVRAMQMPIHTEWKRVGDSIKVLLWNSVDAGQTISVISDSSGVSGVLDWWTWNGSHGRDTLVGKRTTQANTQECLDHGALKQR